MCNTVLDINDKFSITKEDRILGVSSFCFDLSVYDILGSFSSGATLVLIPEVQDIKNVMDVIVREEITVWNSVPAIMELLIDEVEKRDSLNSKNYWDMQEDEVIIVENECTLRLCLLSGDWIPVSLPNKILDCFPYAEVISLGGATEASIWSIYHEIKEEDSDRLSIPYGIPLSNQNMYVLNGELNSCPIEVPGEIYIGGRGVAQAYLNDTIKTKEAFLDTKEYGYIYKTGDYGVMHGCGEIEFLGRKDFQVKIRGYRIELDEIESILAKHDHIERVIVKAEENESKKYLCAFYIGEEVEEDELQKLCKRFLPDYMIPQFYIKIKNIPLTSNGKIDRKALSLPNNLIKKEEVVSPETETQRKLVQLWCEVLNENVIGITDEFFDLGGDSISMIKILSAIEKEFCVKVSYKQFLYCSNIEKLAGYIDQKECETTENKGVKNEAIIWEKENEYKPFKLTEVQNAYFMGRNKVFEMGGVSTHAYYEVVIELDLERFEKALNEVIRVQPMLRTVFFADGTQQVKGVEETQYNMKIQDIRDLSAKEKEVKIQEQRKRMSHAQFNINQYPLFEFNAYKISDDKNYMFIGFDLLIADGASMLILLNQIMTVYEGNLLPEMEFTFRDYVLNLDNIKKTGQYKEDRKYWLQKLKDIPEAAQLPMKVLPESVETPHFRRKTMNIPNKEWDELKELFVKKGITSSVFLCTLYAGLISQWSARKEHTLNLTVFQRYPFHKDVQRMIGDFTSVMLLPVSFDNKNRTIWENAKIIQESIAEGLEHSSYEGIELIREIVKERGMEKKAVMPLVFTSILYNNEELNKQNSIDTIGDIKFSGSQTSQVFLDYQVMESKNGLSITWDYVEELFDEKMIDRMFKQYRKMISEASNLTCITLGKEEERRILQYNNTSKPFSQTNLLQGYLESVNKYQTNVALIHENEHLSYEELDKLVNKVANMLVDNGVKKGDLVGVFASRNIKTIAYILAILKTGAGFIPISLDYPMSRVEFIKEQSQCRFLFDNNFDEKVLDDYKDAFETVDFQGNETAYLIYTSGSTGEPKAVEITHEACVNTIVDMNDILEVTCNDKFIGISSLCFDLSIYDIFGVLQAGASLVIINDQRDIQNIYEVLKRERVTIYNSVPAIMDMLVKEIKGKEKENALRYVLLSGDWIPTYLPSEIKDVFPNASCMSLGGATECSIWSIFYPIKALKKEWTRIPYGIPLANQTVYILNAQGEDCPIGVIGEICIGGLGLAKGYFKDKEKNEKSFFVHPTYGRIYRTGDLGKMDDHGLVWIIGRMDNQVKVNGYRIELEEIINVIEKNKEVSRCVVELNDNNQLITYVEPKRYISNMEDKKNIIEEQIKKEEVNIEQSNDYEDIYKFVEDINRVAETNMLEFFKKYGLWMEENSYLSLEKVQSTITDNVDCYDMITKWMNALVKSEVLMKDNDKYCLTNKINSDIYKLAKVRINEYQNGQWKHLLQYFNDCNSRLDSLILKEVNPLTLLFPDGGYQTVDEIYCNNPVTYPANQIARQAVKNYLEQRDIDKRLNVLEVGAGVGSTTQYILDLFVPEKTVYHYTDISDGFTKYAAEKFKAYNFLEFGVINIDNDFLSQGIEPQSVDLIIAANVIHDAKNILQCLTSLKKVLSPEGMIVFVEGTEATNYELTTVSFLEGLSTYEDERVGKMTPFLTDDEWKAKMITAGFDDPLIYPTKESKSAPLKVKTIVTFNKEFTRLDSEVLNEYATEYLPTYMLPKQYVILDQLPLTPNGKVDHKKLKSIESHIEDNTKKLNKFVVPRNETDKLLVEICSDVFGLENISIDDNIYDIGGDSIKLIRILGVLRNKGYEININELFTLSTIREISDQIIK